MPSGIESVGAHYIAPQGQRDNKKAGKTGKGTVFRIPEGLEQSDPEIARIVEDAPELGDENLSALLDDVHRQGERLGSEISHKALQDYKQALKRFLKKVVAECYELDEHTSGRNILKRKKFTLIRQVNEQLEKLAAGILLQQSGPLEILKRLDEINGLLVDLLH